MSSALRCLARQCLCPTFLRFSSASPISAYTLPRHSIPWQCRSIHIRAFLLLAFAAQNSAHHCLGLSQLIFSKLFRCGHNKSIPGLCLLYVAARFHCQTLLFYSGAVLRSSMPRLYYAIPRLCLLCVATRFHRQTFLLCSDAFHCPTIHLYSCAFIAYRCPCGAAQPTAMP